jgi:hypothetical protein
VGISVGFGAGGVGCGPIPASTGNVALSPHALVLSINKLRSRREMIA